MAYMARNKILHSKEPTARIATRGILFFSILALVLTGWFQTDIKIPAVLAADGPNESPEREADFPTLRTFAKSVENGNARSLAGVYVPGILALAVLQQPAGNPGYVSSQAETVTQFSLAAQYNTVGLLAHNYLAGELFFRLDRNQEVILVFGDGSRQSYMISEVGRYRALSPNSPYSSFEDLDNGTTLSVVELFNQIYAQGGRLVFQTCIEANGNLSWGRLFVTAVPFEKPDKISYKFRPSKLRVD